MLGSKTVLDVLEVLDVCSQRFDTLCVLYSVFPSQPSPLVGRKKTEPGSELTSSLPSRLPRPSEDVFKRLTNDTSSQPEVVHGS